MQRYTSRQSYKLLLEEMPLPSFSLLKKLSQGGIAPMKALMLLLENGHVDRDVVLIIDEMYLQKSCEYIVEVNLLEKMRMVFFIMV